MTVFRTYLKILNRKKIILILYTAIMMIMLMFNFKTNSSKSEFISKKPNVAVINHDAGTPLSEHFIAYLAENTVIKDIPNIDDALFYREISYVLEIPAGFHENIMAGQAPVFEIINADNKESGLMDLLLDSYLRAVNMFAAVYETPEQITEALDRTFRATIGPEMFNEELSSGLDNAVKYFNFANYSVLMCCILVITTVLMAFNKAEVHRRTIVSSINFKQYQRLLTFSNGLYALLVWIFYSLLSFLFVGRMMWTLHGLLYIINLFLFVVCVLCLSLWIGNLIVNKNVVSGVANVVGLGSSFLCGAFVPMEFLPDKVLLFAHILPSYWYIKTNEVLYDLKRFDFEYLRPIILNFSVLIGFALLFLLADYYTAKKHRIFV